MQNDAVTLQCLNDLCKAPNSLTDKFCHRCGTPLSRRYLWVVSEGAALGKIGDLIAERYLLKSQQIVLDTKPGWSPQTLYSDIPTAIRPYLRLIPYQLQIPQVYGLASVCSESGNQEILLLEQAPIYPDTLPQSGQLMPALTAVWQQATSMRQLNWLWQIAQLWQPLQSEGVASSLLAPELIRVEGSLVRLLQLRLDGSETLTLARLGQVWSQLIPGARPAIAEFLTQVCQDLQQGKLLSTEQLVVMLDRGLAEVGRSQTRTIKISTCSDTGPSRQRNEDACYPPSGKNITKPPDPRALTIVCDGVGGHDGGDVAANLAISILQQQIAQLPLEDTGLEATTLISALESSICVANDKISQRNDNERRYGRQRMGTTVVAALVRDREIYLAHVGDSRAYWITHTGCHQITLDDDVAAREVKLGYAFYRDALQQGSSGSLVQALGMNASLYPTVQRLVLDADCVFLLCSDGLSDYDLVEQCWESEILPLLDGKVDLATASQRLAQLGSTQNGHDNVTVSLIHCQINSAEPEVLTGSALVAPTTQNLPSDSNTEPIEVANPTTANSVATESDTQLLPTSPPPRHRSFIPALLGILCFLGVGVGLFVYLSPERLPWLTTASPNPTDTQLPSELETPVPSQVKPEWEPGSRLLTLGEIELSRSPEPAAGDSPEQQTGSTIKDSLPAQSVVQVMERQQTPSADYWLNLRVCSTPVPPTTPTIPQAQQRQAFSGLRATAPQTLQPGDRGWVLATEVKLRVLPVDVVGAEQLKNCPALGQDSQLFLPGQDTG